MAYDHIKEKLRKLLGNTIDQECQAVYLMVQLRKLWEKEGRPSTPLSIWMNWVAHTDLTHEGTVSSLMSPIEDWANEFCKNGAPPLGPQELTFYNFKEDLKNRLVTLDLPTNICDNAIQWKAFITAYSSVIEDGSLTISSPQFNHVEKAIFKKDRPLPNSPLPFSIVWTIFLKNCKYREIELQPLLSERNEFVGWGHEIKQLNPDFVTNSFPIKTSP